MIKRLINFGLYDWKQVWSLFIETITCYSMGNKEQSNEAYFWLKIYLTHDVTRFK